MGRLEVRLYGDPVLHETARPITQITDEHKKLAADMAETMYESRGIGLAANQVGITERIIVVDVFWSEKRNKQPQGRNPIAMINPEILEEGIEDDVLAEGCLSLPEIEGDVWRPTEIKVRYQTLDGKIVERTATELEARCIQHEIDHVNGILFIDRMAADAREKLAGKLAKLRKGNPRAAVTP
jgi:peptide deformylase